MRPLSPLQHRQRELQRNEQLNSILTRLKTEVPDVESGIGALATKLNGSTPKPFTELCARLKVLATSESYQQFDAAVRESYGDSQKFSQAFAVYTNARKLCGRALELGQVRDYLAAACELSPALDIKRKELVAQLNFETIFNDPDLSAERLGAFKLWKRDYIQAYRKGHRAYFERLDQLGNAAEPLKSGAITLSRLNSVAELGPPHAGTANIAADLEKFQEALWICRQTLPKPMSKARMRFAQSVNGKAIKLFHRWSMINLQYLSLKAFQIVSSG